MRSGAHSPAQRAAGCTAPLQSLMASKLWQSLTTSCTARALYTMWLSVGRGHGQVDSLRRGGVLRELTRHEPHHRDLYDVRLVQLEGGPPRSGRLRVGVEARAVNVDGPAADGNKLMSRTSTPRWTHV